MENEIIRHRFKSLQSNRVRAEQSAVNGILKNATISVQTDGAIVQFAEEVLVDLQQAIEMAKEWNKDTGKNASEKL